MDSLRDSVTRIGGISLLIIDPIITAVTGDMHKANDVRRSLQTIVDFAAEMRCAVLGITHFAKGTAGKNSAERVIGSQAFAALARMVLVAAKEEESNRRVPQPGIQTTKRRCGFPRAAMSDDQNAAVAVADCSGVDEISSLHPKPVREQQLQRPGAL